jgi:hypothetical protein
MKKRHRTIDPSKAAAAAGGDPGWYREIPVVDNRPTCTKCGTRAALLGLNGECLRCRLKERAASRPDSAA